MPVHDPPSSFGTAEPVRFSWDDSPLRKRPVTVSEMTNFIVNHLQYVFEYNYRMVNHERVGYLAGDQRDEITVVNGLVYDRSPDAFPKITVTGKWYNGAQSPTTMADAGIGVKMNGTYRTQGTMKLLQGLCTVQVEDDNPSIKRYVADEVQLILLRDGKWMEGELGVRALNVVRPFEQSGEDATGRSASGSRDFSDRMMLTWVVALNMSDWTERAF